MNKGAVINFVLKEAGYSYATAEMIVAIWGKHPYNVDVIKEIHHGAYFNFKDDEGEKHDDGMMSIRDHRTSKSLNRLQEKQFVQETVVSLQIPKGSEQAAFKALEKAVKSFGMKAELLDKWREPANRGIKE